MDFSKRLKKTMEEKNCTMYRLSKSLGVHPTTVSGWVTGKRTPNLEILQKIADALGVTTDYLLDTKPARAVDPNETEAEREKRLGLPEGYFKRLHTPEEVAEEPDVTFDDFTYALYNESKELSDADKEMLLEMARFFKQRLNEEKSNKQ